MSSSQAVVRLLELMRRVIDEQSAERVGLAASGAAFWLVIAALPAAIATISIFGLVLSPTEVAKDLSGLTAGPESLGSILSGQLQKVAAADRVGLSTGLVVSVLLALWSVSAGVYNLVRAIRSAYGLPADPYVGARGRAFVGAMLGVIALGGVALLSAAVSVVLAYLPGVLVAVVGTPVLMLVIAGAIGALYRFALGRRAGIRPLVPGAAASAVGLVVVAGGFGIYLGFSTHYTAVYGALAGAVIGMVGTYLAVYIVLLGAVLNAQLELSTDTRGRR